MIKYKIISTIIKAICDEKRAKGKREELKKKAMNRSSSHVNTTNRSHNMHPIVPDVIDAVVVEVDNIAKDDDERWNDFNHRCYK